MAPVLLGDFNFRGRIRGANFGLRSIPCVASQDCVVFLRLDLFSLSIVRASRWRLHADNVAC